MKSSRERAGAFILCGGRSSRMGDDKALLEVDGETMLARTAGLFAQIGIDAGVVGEPIVHKIGGRATRPDLMPGRGPLGGIVTALSIATKPWNILVACDMPYLTVAWFEYLEERALGSDGWVVVPEGALGLEPLCAAYRVDCLETFHGRVKEGKLKVGSAIEAVRHEKIAPEEWKRFDLEGLLFKNMNAPGDYEEAVRRLAGQKKGKREG
jgi:molybdopterin-guanine dinucleotide biosynthesis protein A